MYKHRQTDAHTESPSGQGLTLTLKGLCLAPVIATPQAGCAVSISASVCLRVQVCEKPQSRSELLQTPSAP